MARESGDLAVARVLPRGYSRPATQGLWRDVMRDVLDAAPILANRRATTEAIASALMYCADWESLTSRPTWDRLIDHCKATTGRGSRATIARALALMIDLKLIARVAHGRQGKYAPGDPETNPNEAAVYVLLVPSPVHVVEDGTEPEASSPVDEIETPPRRLESVALPVRAREEPNYDSEPLRGPERLTAAQAPPPQRAQRRQHPAWPGHATALRKDHMLSAAFELQRRLPVLRQISAKDLRSCLRHYFLAGWTVADVAHALDWKPDGGRWPHSGATGIGPTSVRGWIAHRLAPWASEGTPRRSFGQRAAAERAERLARQQAQRERDAAERAQRGNPARCPIVAAAKAHIGHVRYRSPSPDCPWCPGQPDRN